MNICLGQTRCNLRCARKVNNGTYCYQHHSQAPKQIPNDYVPDDLEPIGYEPDQLVATHFVDETVSEELVDDLNSIDSLDSINSYTSVEEVVIKTNHPIVKPNPKGAELITKIMKRYEDKKKRKERSFLKAVYVECYKLLSSKTKKY